MFFPLSATPAENFATSFAGVVDTGGKLPPVSLIRRQICRRCRWHQWQICHQYQQHQRNWWQNLPPVSLTPVANLPPVSLIPAAILPPASLTPAANLPPVSLIRLVHLYLWISLRIFEKIWNGPNGILWGWGETDSWKNQKQKISWHCPFKSWLFYFTYWRILPNIYGA